MSDTIVLVGFCGSRSLDSQWRELVAHIVSAVAKVGRGIAVGCARGADAMALQACFTESWGLRAPFLRVFAAFGPSGEGSWQNSAVKLVTIASRLPMAMDFAGNGKRIVVNWWAGGGPDTGLVSRLKQRSDAMVEAVTAAGEGRGIVAFVCGGQSKSPGTWGTVRLAVERSVPVVVFGCGCDQQCFPSLGKGCWARAGKGIWASGWRWMPARSSTPDPTDANTAAFARYAARKGLTQKPLKPKETTSEQKSLPRNPRHKTRHAGEEKDEPLPPLVQFLSDILGWKKLPPDYKPRRFPRHCFPFF